MLVITGCAADQHTDGRTAARSGASDNVVLMAKSYRFEPTTIQVPLGTSLTWINDDNFTHNVQLTGGLNWVSPNLKPGDSASYTFDVPGTYEYLCVFHSQNMRGQVVVLPRG
jgi:plastocyanin